MDDREAERPLEGVEIAIVVEQGVPAVQTEGSDQTVDRAAYDDPLRAEPSVVPGCSDGEGDPAGREDLESQQLPLDGPEALGARHALEHLAEDEVRQAKPLMLQIELQPAHRRSVDAAQVVDPDGGIDDDHDAT